jgi:hypothetical protein
VQSSSVSFKFLPEMSDSTEIPLPENHGRPNAAEVGRSKLHDPLESLEVLQRIALMIFESSSPEGTFAIEHCPGLRQFALFGRIRYFR